MSCALHNTCNPHFAILLRLSNKFKGTINHRMSKLEGLGVDLVEIQKFLNTSTRPRVRKLLERELSAVQDEITLEELSESTPETSVKIEKAKERRPQAYTTKITSYGWDQSEKFVKIYITLPGVEKLPKEKVVAKFRSKAIDLMVYDLDGKNHQLQLLRLLNEIIPSGSYVKTKPGSLTVLMKKAELMKNWACLNAKEKAEKDSRSSPAEKGNDSKDPGEGIMDLMKKMYQDGDDEMKRTIAKAWTESREKTSMGGATQGLF